MGLAGRCSAALAFYVVFALPAAAHAAVTGAAFRVQNINTISHPDPGPDPFDTPVTVVGDRVFFRASNSRGGRELWASDGTRASARLVSDIEPAPRGSSCRDFTEAWANEQLFPLANGVVFTASVRGRPHVAFSDGTASGPVLLIPDVRIESIAGAENRAFVASGTQLWVTDGTAVGTRLVRDFADPVCGDPWLYPTALTAAPGGVVFTSRAGWPLNPSSPGVGPWFSDGTPEGTNVLRGDSVARTSSVARPDSWEEKRTTAKTGWRSSRAAPEPNVWATVNGRRLVMEVVGVGQFVIGAWRDNLPIVAIRATDSREVLATAVYPKPVPFRDGVLFSRHLIDGELWWTDGTPEGTFPLREPDGPDAPARWDESSSPRELTVSGGALYFSADDGVHGRELWAMAEGEPASLVADLVEGPVGSDPSMLAPLRDGVFFSAKDAGGISRPHFATATGSVVRLASARPWELSEDDRVFAGEIPTTFALATASRSVVVFAANDDQGAGELWRTDGTAEGTFSLGPLNRWDAAFLGAVGEQVYLCARDANHEAVLLVTDGSQAGTITTQLPCWYWRVWPVGDQIIGYDGDFKRIDPASATQTHVVSARWEARDSQALGGLLFGVWDDFLWRSDGTAEGTQRIEPFDGAVYAGGGRLLGVRTRGGAIFSIDGPPVVREFWGSDGRAGGLRKLAEFEFPWGPDDLWGPGWERPWPAVLGDTVYFSADGDSSGYELWGIALDQLPEVCLASDCVPPGIPAVRLSPTPTRTPARTQKLASRPPITPCSTSTPGPTFPITPMPTFTLTRTLLPTRTATPVGSPTPRCDEENSHTSGACAAIHWNSMEARRGQVFEVSATLTTTRNSVAGLQVDISVPASVHLLSDSNSAPACRVTEGFDGLVANFAWPAASRDRVRALFVSPESPQAIPDGEHSFACKAQVSADAPLGGGPGRLQQVVATDPFGRVIYPTIHNGTLTVTAGEPPTADLPGWACECDCDESRAVSVDELLAGTNITLGLLPESVCLPTRRDLNWDVGRIVTCVGRALSGCPVP